MAKRSTDEIIHSLATMTGHTEREMLEASLATTLYELLDITSISLYRVFYEHKQAECYRALEVTSDDVIIHDINNMPEQIDVDTIPGLHDCLETQQPATLETDSFRSYLYPVTDHLGKIAGVFVLVWDVPVQAVNEKFIRGYFQIYRNYLRLLDESEHDTLTGLLNRRTFDVSLGRVLEEWHKEHDNEQNTVESAPTRRHSPESRRDWLAVIDIDHFKRINDTWGHLYGDEVLLLLANIMRDTFRGYDKLFRFGGEEFVAILRTTDPGGAAKALERFRRSVEEYRFPQIDKVTVSVGYIEITGQSIPAEVLGHADEALYFAKQNGRNRVCQYEQLVENGDITVQEEIQGQDMQLL